MATNRIARRWLTSLAGVTVAVSLAAQGAQIAPRDQLNIVVSGSSEMTRKVVVDADGTFDFPMIGRIKAAGRTTREVASDLKTQLDGPYLINPTVTVELEQSKSKHFSVIGEVSVKGTFPFGGQLTLLDALAQAGSVTENASDEALIIHAGSGATAAPTKVDLYELLNGTSLKNNIAIQDGDMINIVAAKPVYITGFVKSQGAFPVRRGMTVQQALTLAGGVSDKGKEKGTRIERLDADGKKITIQVKDLKSEIVKPGDTIIVPARIW